MTPEVPPSAGSPWPDELTRATGRQIQRCRTDPWRATKMSAEQLAKAVTQLGLPYTRAQVTNLEAGRRTSVTLGEILAIAAVLEVPPLLLMMPLGAEHEVDFLPGQTGRTWDAVRWLIGDEPPPGWTAEAATETAVGGWPQRLRRFSRPIALYRQHDQHLDDWRHWVRISDGDTARILNAQENLRQTRDYMRELGLVLPDLPAELVHVDAAPA